jgi:hypothetical protein
LQVSGNLFIQKGDNLFLVVTQPFN